ncbi:MAG: DUF362 domain-containing protein [Fidelibacterota bacterium]
MSMDRNRVVILDADYEGVGDPLREALEYFDLDLSGKNVFIKPNMLSRSSPERGVTSHPSILRELISWTERYTENILVGDNPGATGYGANEKCARATGIKEVSGKYFKNIGKQTKAVKLKSKFTKALVVSEDILKTDFLISVPKFKTHLQTVITGGIKNSYGILVGGEKSRLHILAQSPRSFAEAILDVFQIRIPDLFVMDAVVGMEGNGPNGGILRRIGKIMVSNNGVALDSVMATMMGIPPGSVPCLIEAYRRGLGEIDLRRIEVIGEVPLLQDFKVPVTYTRGLWGTLVNRWVYIPLVRSRVKVREKNCTRCMECIKGCPTGAMKLDGEFPRVYDKECINCYCCRELCLYNAVDIKGTVGFLSRR